MRQLFAILLFAVSSTAWSATLTIDFESVEQSDLVNLFPPGPGDDGSKAFSTDGFDFTLNGGLQEDPGNKLVFGSKIQQLFTPDAYVRMSRTDGANFALLDVGLLDCGVTCNIRGVRDDGGSFTIFNTTDINDLGSGDWLNVTSVTFGVNEPEIFFNDVRVDDITVASAVPVPAAVWLFGSALAGIGWIRRRG